MEGLARLCFQQLKIPPNHIQGCELLADNGKPRLPYFTHFKINIYVKE